MASPHPLPRRTARRAAALAVLWLAACGPALADTIQDRVQVSENDLDAALARFPAYKPLADGIAADCAQKLPDDARIGGFCRCAAAVTFTLWRSEIDEGDMLERMNDYLQNPTESGVAYLLRYQDPGLYKSACEKALGKS